MRYLRKKAVYKGYTKTNILENRFSNSEFPKIPVLTGFEFTMKVDQD